MFRVVLIKAPTLGRRGGELWRGIARHAGSTLTYWVELKPGAGLESRPSRSGKNIVAEAEVDLRVTPIGVAIENSGRIHQEFAVSVTKVVQNGREVPLATGDTMPVAEALTF